MKLVFKKANNEYITSIMHDNAVNEFDYVAFVKLICLGSPIEAPFFEGDISEEERRIITDFVDEIRKRVEENSDGLPSSKTAKRVLPPKVKRDRFMEK